MTETELRLKLRPGRLEDAEQAGKIIFRAFAAIAEKHGFPPDFPSLDAGRNVATSFLSQPGFYSIVAEYEDKVVGSNFLDERSIIAGVGPITVDPNYQNKGIGRLLMIKIMERANNQNFPGVRLLQTAYHNRSLALYAILGFEIREPLSTMQGKPIREDIPGRIVRPATDVDVETCNAVCKAVYGHNRNGELRDSMKQGSAKVVLHGERITGYTTGMAFFNHSVGLTNDDLKALIASAVSYGGPGILIPTRNTQLLRWCLNKGLKLVQQLNLMTVGMYNEPAGAYMPSILY
ncbi:MAG: GNAT family N-acetyltransferase [Thermoproteota archaeon]|nr:GNAT family N-acetyltransferase [Thermoproteota archaeon]